MRCTAGDFARSMRQEYPFRHEQPVCQSIGLDGALPRTVSTALGTGIDTFAAGEISTQTILLVRRDASIPTAIDARVWKRGSEYASQVYMSRSFFVILNQAKKIYPAHVFGRIETITRQLHLRL